LTGAGNGSVSSVIGTTTGTLTKSGTGTWTLTGDNTYSGATTIDNGTLNANGTSSNQALGGTSGVTVNSGGTLLLGNSNQINNSAGLTLNGGTFALGGKSEGAAGTTGVGSLTLTSNSTIDFAIGTFSSIVQFAGFNEVTEVPEPSTWVAAALAQAAIAFSQRKRVRDTYRFLASYLSL